MTLHAAYRARTGQLNMPQELRCLEGVFRPRLFDKKNSLPYKRLGTSRTGHLFPFNNTQPRQHGERASHARLSRKNDDGGLVLSARQGVPGPKASGHHLEERAQGHFSAVLCSKAIVLGPRRTFQ